MWKTRLLCSRVFLTLVAAAAILLLVGVGTSMLGPDQAMAGETPADQAVGRGALGQGDGRDSAKFGGESPRIPPPPLPRQLRQTLPAPVMEEDPDAPVVDVAAEAALIGVAAGDLDPTPDVQITQEIIDKAAELGTPEAMYEFVRNECAFQPYYGSQKGSVETLRQRAGNDHDLASLLIALYRASGIPARYAVGMVEMPVGRVTSWLAVDDGTAAGSILFTQGMEGIAIVSGPNVVAVRCRRVWVEAYVSRGFGSPTWVPLDPSFALTTVQPGIDIPEEMALDALGVVDDYWDPADAGVTLPRTETIQELLEQDIQSYLDTNYPGMTVSDVLRKHEIVAEALGALPASLPYTVRSRDLTFSEIPADRRYQIRIRLYNGGTGLIDQTMNLPEIAGKRITIDYEGATPTDVATIDANGGIYSTPPSLVNLRPVLRIDGTQVAVGATGIGMGVQHSSDVYFMAPVNAGGMPVNVVPLIQNVITCGASQTIGLAIEGTSEGLLVAPPADDTEGTLPLLYDTAMDYMANVRNDDLRLAALMHSFVTTGVTSAIVENVVTVTASGFDWNGLRVDADRSIVGVWPVDRYPGGSEPADFLIIGGANGSVWEHQIYENSFGQDSVSTIKILELAIDSGVTVYKRVCALPLPANTQSASVRSALESAILGGNCVTFPADPMTVGAPATGEWSGTGWIDMDLSTGAAGYLISGSNNGGATFEYWPPEFIDLQAGDRTVTQVVIEIVTPSADSPDASAVYTRDNEENLVFEYQLLVSYDDGSTATLPGGGSYYRRETRNTTKTFLPGNYRFHIWISRTVWWIFQVTIAHEHRDVSIVGVLIREDDGSQFGAAPPKMIGVEPPAPAPKPSKDVKALVIPEQAPDGTPLASAFAWSGGAKLAFTTPTVQTTKIEPAGPDPSTAMEDQDVDVDVTLPGGKIAHGFAAFNFAAGGTDEVHKMTVFSVEIDKCLNTFMPQGGASDNTVDITARALPTGMEGQFIFTLFEVSHEDGYCTNAPKSLPFLPWSEDGSLHRDFQFESQAGFNIDGVFWNYRAKTDATNLDEATVTVNCYDYGAYGKIKAEFKTEDDTYLARETGGTKEETNLPLDDDDNHIADNWVGNAGGAVDDTDNIPAPGISNGDGLSRYEEFRGFIVSAAHVRTLPTNKDVFIYDEDGIGLGNFGASNLTTHLVTADEFNGTDKREINFRHESHHVVLQHGLWLRDQNLGGMGSWGDAEAVGSPGAARVHINVDMAQILADMTNAPPAGFRPAGANNRVGVAQPQIIAHELGHGVAVFHHGPGTYAGTHTGDTTCVMRYYFIDMQTAAALAPPADAAAFNAVPIGNTFDNAAPDVCRSDIDIRD